MRDRGTNNQSRGKMFNKIKSKIEDYGKAFIKITLICLFIYTVGIILLWEFVKTHWVLATGVAVGCWGICQLVNRRFAKRHMEEKYNQDAQATNQVTGSCNLNNQFAMSAPEIEVQMFINNLCANPNLRFQLASQGVAVRLIAHNVFWDGFNWQSAGYNYKARLMGDLTALSRGCNYSISFNCIVNSCMEVMGGLCIDCNNVSGVLVKSCSM